MIARGVMGCLDIPNDPAERRERCRRPSQADIYTTIRQVRAVPPMARRRSNRPDLPLFTKQYYVIRGDVVKTQFEHLGPVSAEFR